MKSSRLARKRVETFVNASYQDLVTFLSKLTMSNWNSAPWLKLVSRSSAGVNCGKPSMPEEILTPKLLHYF